MSKLGSLIKKYRRDLILIAVLLAVSLGFVIYMTANRVEGARAVVRINGKIVATYSLEKDGVYVLNNGTNVLTIENGFAYMSVADCPDKICMNTGRVRFNGQTITCLPNKVTVTVEESESGIDMTTG